MERKKKPYETPSSKVHDVQLRTNLMDMTTPPQMSLSQTDDE